MENVFVTGRVLIKFFESVSLISMFILPKQKVIDNNVPLIYIFLKIYSILWTMI